MVEKMMKNPVEIEAKLKKRFSRGLSEVLQQTHQEKKVIFFLYTH